MTTGGYGLYAVHPHSACMKIFDAGHLSDVGYSFSKGGVKIDGR